MSGSHNDETCDALDDILDYLDTLGTYGNCSRNSDCDEIVCENRRGNELSLKFLPCRSHPAVRVELSYDGDTYFSKTVSDETLSVQVTVNNFTFSVIVTVEDRRDSIYLEVRVAWSQCSTSAVYIGMLCRFCLQVVEIWSVSVPQVLVKTEGLTVTVVPNTKVPQDCTGK